MSSRIKHPAYAGLAVLAISLGAVTTGTKIAYAQEQALLKRVQVVGGAAGTCSAIFIGFDTELRVLATEYSADRRTVSIRMARPIGDTLTGPGAELIETHPRIDLPGLGRVDVSLDVSRSPLLTLRFLTPVQMQIAQAGESSVLISEIAHAGAASCDVVPSGADLADIGTDVPADGAVVGEFENDYADARRSIIQGDFVRAIQILTTLVAAPENELSPDAQELLGIARERNGQLAHAKAEFETYLAKYPDAEGAPRVKQRLAAVLTAESQAPTPLDGTDPDQADGTALAGLGEEELPTFRPRLSFPPADEFEEKAEPPFRGLVSSYYFRNEGSTVFTEFLTNTTDTEDEVFENALVTSLDFEGRRETDSQILTWRIAGDHEAAFGDPVTHSLSLSRAYFDVENKSSKFSYRIGRQSRSNSGIMGRFDGAEATLPLDNGIELKAVLGSPVESSSDGVFATDKILMGVSASFQDIIPNLDATAYFVNQTREGYTDRKAVGLEGQFQTNTVSVTGVLDYDTYFGEVGLGRLSGTWIGPDQSSITASAEYLKSPVLSFSNALTGQTATSLETLSATYTTAEMKQLALDRTTTTKSLSLAYSRPITESWQFSVDGSIFHTGGSPASGGVPAQPSTGSEYYASAQFVGQNIFLDRDTVSVALRYANSATSDLILLDAYERFQIKDGIQIKPRIRLGLREFTTGGQEFFAVPTVNATYKYNDSTDFEIEIGGRLSNRATPAFAEESNEFFITAGINKQF